MTLNLDYIGAVGTAWAAFCVFGLHGLSNPKHERHFAVPRFVRMGFVICGVAFVWRAASFYSIGADPYEASITPAGILSLAAMDYLFTAMVVWRGFVAHPRIIRMRELRLEAAE